MGLQAAESPAPGGSQQPQGLGGDSKVSVATAGTWASFHEWATGWECVLWCCCVGTGGRVILTVPRLSFFLEVGSWGPNLLCLR